MPVLAAVPTAGLALGRDVLYNLNPYSARPDVPAGRIEDGKPPTKILLLLTDGQRECRWHSLTLQEREMTEIASVIKEMIAISQAPMFMVTARLLHCIGSRPARATALPTGCPAILAARPRFRESTTTAGLRTTQDPISTTRACQKSGRAARAGRRVPSMTRLRCCRSVSPSLHSTLLAFPKCFPTAVLARPSLSPPPL